LRSTVVANAFGGEGRGTTPSRYSQSHRGGASPNQSMYTGVSHQQPSSPSVAATSKPRVLNNLLLSVRQYHPSMAIPFLSLSSCGTTPRLYPLPQTPTQSATPSHQRQSHLLSTATTPAATDQQYAFTPLARPCLLATSLTRLCIPATGAASEQPFPYKEPASLPLQVGSH
jgi:hypothetical protein